MRSRCRWSMVLRCLAGAFSLMVLAACGGGGGGGSAANNDVTPTAIIQGTWGNGTSNITFMADSTYQVDTNNNGTADAWGTYSTTGHQLTLIDTGGTSACYNTSTQTFDSGKYNYTVTGNTVSLTLISDTCSGRTTTMTTNWTAQNTSSSDTSAPTVPANLTATAISALCRVKWVPGIVC